LKQSLRKSKITEIEYLRSKLKTLEIENEELKAKNLLLESRLFEFVKSLNEVCDDYGFN